MERRLGRTGVVGAKPSSQVVSTLILVTCRERVPLGPLSKHATKLTRASTPVRDNPQTYNSSCTQLTFTVKKIRLRTNQRDTRIFREVNALSRLSHRYIVRYYTTWVEMAETIALGPSSDSETASDSGTEGNLTSVPHSFREKSDPFTIDLSELDDYGGSGSKSSFPSIHFTRSDVKDEKDEDEDDSDDGLENLFTSDYPEEADTKPPPVPPRTLYIQMVRTLTS